MALYTPVQSPAIPISLFGEAAKTGAALGQAIPSTTTAIIQGLEKGVDKALDWEEQRNRIEAQQQVLDRAETRQTQEDDQLKQENIFLEDFQKADPFAKAEIIFDSKYTGVFAKNPALYEQAVRAASPYMSESELEAATLNVGKYSISNAYDKEAEKRSEAWQQIQDQVFNDSYAQEAGRELGVEPYRIPDLIEDGTIKIVPSRTYQIDRDTGRIAIDRATGERVKNEIDSGTRDVDLIVGDKIIASGVPAESMKLLSNYTTQQRLQNGTYSRQRQDEYERNFRKANRQAPAAGMRPSEPTLPIEEKAPFETPYKGPEYVNPNGGLKPDKVAFEAPNGVVSASDSPQVYNYIQKRFGLPEKVFKEVKGDLQEFLQLVDLSNTNVFGRWMSDYDKRINDINAKLAIKIAKAEYDTKPTIRVNAESVANHNVLVNSIKRALTGNPWDMFGSDMRELEKKASAVGLTPEMMMEVETPKQLYVLRRGTFFNTMLEDTYKELAIARNAYATGEAKQAARSNKSLQVLKEN